MFNIAYFLLDLILIVAVQMNIIAKSYLVHDNLKTVYSWTPVLGNGVYFHVFTFSAIEANMHNIKAKTWMFKRI